MSRRDRVRVGILTYGLDRPPSGIGRYTIELIKALRTHQPEIDLCLIKPFARPIPGLLDAESQILRLYGVRLLPMMMGLGPLEIAALAARHRLDVVHDPAGVSPFLLPRRLARFARVVTIHDVIPFVHPETHATLTNLLFRRYIPQTLRFVDRIVTVSDASKRDIEQFFGVDERRVVRSYCGVGDRFRPQDAETVARVLERHGILRPYVLTVGAIQARKNIGGLIQAFDRLKTTGLSHQLVVVGNRAWKSAEAFREIQNAEAVKWTGYVDDADLPALYTGSDAFVFPSLYEGFGLPPLEAMACGAPVIASRSSSLPEVVGDAGLLVDPHDIDGLADAIRRVTGDPVFRRELGAKGVARARRFRWERAAADHAELYRELATDCRY